MSDANPDTTHPKTASRAVHEVYQAAERFDWIAELYDGEYTPEVAAAEREFFESEDSALDSLVDYDGYCESIVLQAEREKERLDAVIERYKARRERVHGHLRRIVERRCEGTRKRSISVGLHKVKLVKGSEYVHVEPDVDVEALPPNVVRYVSPKPGKYEIDKNAAKDQLKKGTKIPGLEVRRRATRVKVE